MENNEMNETEIIETNEVTENTESGFVRQDRWRSWAVWVSVLGAVWTILNALGITQQIGIEETTFKMVVDAVGVILIAFGILNNPTNKANF
jgi:uncharacterized membrane protein